MIKKGLSILMLALFCLQSANPVLIIACYSLNKSFISENLCVNKEVVNSHCEGKCHMQKQLQHEEQTQDESAPLKIINTEFQFFNDTQPAFITIVNSVHEKFFRKFIEEPLTGVSFSIFHPPLV